MRIVHALRGGPLGFNQMKRDGGGVNSTTLAQRLVLLEQVGLLQKTVQSVARSTSARAWPPHGRADRSSLVSVGGTVGGFGVTGFDGVGRSL